MTSLINFNKNFIYKNIQEIKSHQSFNPILAMEFSIHFRQRVTTDIELDCMTYLNL